jgi:hypothetical protein
VLRHSCNIRDSWSTAYLAWRPNMKMALFTLRKFFWVAALLFWNENRATAFLSTRQGDQQQLRSYSSLSIQPSHSRRQTCRSTSTRLFLTPAHISDVDEVLRIFAMPNSMILDVRTQPEIDTQGLIQTNGRWLQTSCSPMECPSLAGAARTMFPDKNS